MLTSTLQLRMRAMQAFRFALPLLIFAVPCIAETAPFDTLEEKPSAEVKPQAPTTTKPGTAKQPNVGDVIDEISGEAPSATKPIEPSDVEPTPDDNATLIAARTAFMAGNVQECMSLLRDAVAADPQLAPPELNLAAFSLEAGLRTQALSLLEKVAAEDESHPQLHLLYANLALADGRLTEALMHFDRLDADSLPSGWSQQQQQDLTTSILAGRATVAERRGNWEMAQQHLAKWLKITPDNTALRYRWAKALLHSGKQSKALEQFDIAYRQNKQLNRPEVAIGVEYLSQGEVEKANKSFAEALEKYPDDGPLHYAWAMALMFQDRFEEAEASTRKAAELGPNTTKLRLLRGVTARAIGKHDAALAHFREILKANPDDREATYQLILTLAAHPSADQRASALALATAAAAKHPQSPTAQAALAIAQQAAKKSDEALAALEKVVRRPDARPEWLYLYGQVLEGAERPGEARQIAERLEQQIATPSIFVERAAAERWIANVRKDN
jgi:tetratricopeptide (TPR) repeat protein